MGVTFIPFNNGDVMNAAALRSNINALRAWLAGGIITSDIADASVQTRHLRRLDHYATIENARSTGTSGTTLRGVVDTDPMKRIYATVDSHGDANWTDLAGTQRRIYCPSAGTVEVVVDLWAWAIQSDQTTPEAFDAATFRLALGPSGVAASQRTLLDAGHDPAANGAGQYAYSARNLPMIFQRNVSAGWNNLRVQVKVADHGSDPLLDRPKYSLIIIGARNFHVEYWTR